MSNSLKSINDNQTIEQWENDGKYHSIFREYYHDKNICLETTYVGKKKNGYIKKWYPSGTLKKFIEYANDKKNGVFQRYYDNGQPLILGEYREGVRIGVWKYWKKNGILYQEKRY